MREDILVAGNSFYRHRRPMTDVLEHQEHTWEQDAWSRHRVKHRLPKVPDTTILGRMSMTTTTTTDGSIGGLADVRPD